MPVTLQAGTEYEQSGAKVKITEYERDKVYAAHFVSDRFDIIIKYVTEDNDQGVKITFSEEMLHFEREKHGKLQTMFYNWQLKMGANKELKRMADNVYANMAAQNRPLSIKKCLGKTNFQTMKKCLGKN